MRIELGHSVVRDWQTTDEESLARYANNRDVWRNLLDEFPHPYTRDHAAHWIAQSLSRKPRTHWAIEVGGEAVGGIGIRIGADVYRRSAEIGYWLGEPFWGRGIMTDVVQAVSQRALDKLDLCRLHAGVFEWNAASMRVLEKAGFLAEGRRRKAITKDGVTVDAVEYALVR